MEWKKLLNFPKLFKRKSGRPGSNRRRPAWEAGILPLNYAREPRDRSAVAARWQQRAAAAIAPDGSLTAWGPAPTIRRGHGDVAGRLEHDADGHPRAVRCERAREAG